MKRIKKIITAVLVLSLAVGAAACGNKKETSTNEKKQLRSHIFQLLMQFLYIWKKRIR